MCGLLGIWDEIGADRRREFSRLLSTLDHRGPDESWSESWEDWTFGFTRLQIVDSRRPPGDHSSPPRAVTVMFNGEIWNYRALLDDCLSCRNGTELDAIRCSYLREGASFASRLNGIFAIVILDRERGELLMIRDPIGVKPLYYFVGSAADRFIFASDVKTIAMWEAFRPVVNLRYVVNNYCFGYSDYTDNLFCGIEQIPPSTIVTVTLAEGRIQISSRAYVMHGEAAIDGPVIDVQLEILQEVVRSQYEHVARYPIGLLLSGGIDSSLLLFIASRLGLRDIVCFYCGERSSPDYYWAKHVAELEGYELRVISLAPEACIASWRDACYFMSGALPGLYYISNAVKQLCPEIRVLWCGEGSDELYGGYRWYQDPAATFNRIAARVATCGVSTSLIERFAEVHRRSLHGNPLPQLLSFFMDEQLVNSHLVPHDAGSMAHSMELRVPFLDLRNVALASRLSDTEKMSGEGGKAILKRVLRNISGIENVEYYCRKKLAILDGLSRVQTAFRKRALAMIEDSSDSPLTYRPWLSGPFHELWYRLIEEVFIGPRDGAPLLPPR